MELPKEIEWNIVKYMCHPVADMIHEWKYDALECDTWEWMVHEALCDYRDKVRRKPLHGEIMKVAIRYYRDDIRWRKRNRQVNTASSFSKHYFDRQALKNSCGCCCKPWQECQCWCSNCGGEWKACRAACYDL